LHLSNIVNPKNKDEVDVHDGYIFYTKLHNITTKKLQMVITFDIELRLKRVKKESYLK